MEASLKKINKKNSEYFIFKVNFIYNLKTRIYLKITLTIFKFNKINKSFEGILK